MRDKTATLRTYFGISNLSSTMLILLTNFRTSGINVLPTQLANLFAKVYL